MPLQIGTNEFPRLIIRLDNSKKNFIFNIKTWDWHTCTDMRIWSDVSEKAKVFQELNFVTKIIFWYFILISLFSPLLPLFGGLWVNFQILLSITFYTVTLKLTFKTGQRKVGKVKSKKCTLFVNLLLVNIFW